MHECLQGAQCSIYCASSPLVTLDVSRGGAPYYQNCREVPVTPIALDDDASLRLWHKSMQMLQLK